MVTAPLTTSGGVAVRTMQRWAKGEYEISDGIWEDIAVLLRKRGEALLEIHEGEEIEIAASCRKRAAALLKLGEKLGKL